MSEKREGGNMLTEREKEIRWKIKEYKELMSKIREKLERQEKK